MLKYCLFSLKRRNLLFQCWCRAGGCFSAVMIMMFFQNTATVLILQILFNRFHAGTNIRYFNFSWEFAGNDCKNLIFPVNLALKRNWDPHFTVGALQDLCISHSWLTDCLGGFTSTYYFSPCCHHVHHENTPIKHKLMFYEKKIWKDDDFWVWIKQTVLEILQIQAHAWTVPHFLVCLLPVCKLRVLAEAHFPRETKTLQTKHSHWSPINI